MHGQEGVLYLGCPKSSSESSFSAVGPSVYPRISILLFSSSAQAHQAISKLGMHLYTSIQDSRDVLASSAAHGPAHLAQHAESCIAVLPWRLMRVHTLEEPGLAV